MNYSFKQKTFEDVQSILLPLTIMLLSLVTKIIPSKLQKTLKHVVYLFLMDKTNSILLAKKIKKTDKIK